VPPGAASTAGRSPRRRCRARLRGSAWRGWASPPSSRARCADALPGLGPGTGLALVGSLSRVAKTVAPPVIGLVADAVSLRVALLSVPLAALALVLLSRALPSVRFQG
jgi:hypothetical protein